MRPVEKPDKRQSRVQQKIQNFSKEGILSEHSMHMNTHVQRKPELILTETLLTRLVNNELKNKADLQINPINQDIQSLRSLKSKNNKKKTCYRT